MQLRDSDGRVTWCSGREGVRIHPQPRTPDHVCDNWAEVIPVPDAAAECRCAMWERRVWVYHVGNCSGFNRTGRTVLYSFKRLLFVSI